MIPVAISEDEIESWEGYTSPPIGVIATFKRPVGFHKLARVVLNRVIYRVVYVDDDRRTVWLRKLEEIV